MREKSLKCTPRSPISIVAPGSSSTHHRHQYPISCSTKFNLPFSLPVPGIMHRYIARVIHRRLHPTGCRSTEQRLDDSRRSPPASTVANVPVVEDIEQQQEAIYPLVSNQSITASKGRKLTKQ